MQEQETVVSSTVNWVGTTISIGIVVIILAALFFILKLSGDDTGKHHEIKQYFNALFGGGVSPKENEEAEAKRKAEAARLAANADPFEEVCPACGEVVTHQDIDCPSCGLRLF